MINPNDIEKLNTEKDHKDLDPEFVSEFTNGKDINEKGSGTNE